MKKILSVVLAAIIITLIGCGADKKNNESSDITILKDNKIDYLTIQFKTNTVKITDNEKIQSIKKMFEGELKRNQALDKEKGWIYKITANDNNNLIEEFFIINDTNIRINDKIYTCEKIVLSRLDEIFEIDREN